MRYEEVQARWRVVSAAQFNALLSTYPRKWQVDPPLSQQAVFRNFRDTTLGEYPGDVIATWNMSQWFGLFTVRLDVPDWCAEDGVGAANGCGHDASLDVQSRNPA